MEKQKERLLSLNALEIVRLRPNMKSVNNLLAHKLESCAVIEDSTPDKEILLECVLANLSKHVKRGC